MIPSLFRYLPIFLFRRPPQNTGSIPLGLPTTPDRTIYSLYPQSKRRSWLDPPSLTMHRYQRMVAVSDGLNSSSSMATSSHIPTTRKVPSAGMVYKHFPDRSTQHAHQTQGALEGYTCGVG